MAGPFSDALSDLREYLTLSDVEARAKDLAPERRGDVARAVLLSVQKRVAAQTLHADGQRAEALRLARDAHELLQAHEALAHARLEAAPAVDALPSFEEDVSEEHDRVFEALVARQIALQVDLDAISLEPSVRRYRRLERRVVVVLTLLAFVVPSIWWWRHTVLTATASAQSGDRWGPENAVDGSEKTHWVLPDGMQGYLDVTIKPPQKLTTVTVMNGWDPIGYAVTDYRLEAWSGTRLLATQDGSLSRQVVGAQTWTTIPFAVDRKVDRLRFVVKTHIDHAGALAEVKIP